MNAKLPRSNAAGLTRRSAGFTLMELMVTVAIVGILAAIAIPAYTQSVVKSNRRAAQVCLASFATHMERFYTTNLRYDQTVAGVAMNTAALQALGLDCASDVNTGSSYSYSFDTGTPSASAYTLVAAPIGAQATRDVECGSLKLDQAGTRRVTGSAPVADCW
ncbi:MAG: type IV pilin protein [Nevskiaceae bacterium]|nr:MAG: type IV pilin protein [Nevskiaceae bacterium]TAM23149.1 MAG: type IV pilin protein [Nevskiaceae bacterium]